MSLLLRTGVRTTIYGQLSSYDLNRRVGEKIIYVHPIFFMNTGTVPESVVYQREARRGLLSNKRRHDIL